MFDVHDLATRSAVLLEQASDGFPAGFSIGDLQVAFGVLILGIDDNQRRVRGRSCTRANAK